MQTVVGLYRTVDEANKVKQALLSEGYSSGDVRVIDQSENSYSSGTSYEGGDANDSSVGGKIKSFFQGLTGHDEHTHTAYTEGVSRGGALVAVNVSEGEADRAAAVLQSYGASDIEGDSTYTNTSSDLGGTSANRATTSGYGSGEQVIPVVEEALAVGKRQVERGGVRVYSRVVSQPVSESVNLHDERVLVDRRAVDRPATEADFTDAGPIEVRAMGEEAVVEKTGRVVEEVVVGKTATDRTETIEDSVRRTEVDVQPVQTGAGTVNTKTPGSKY